MIWPRSQSKFVAGPHHYHHHHHHHHHHHTHIQDCSLRRTKGRVELWGQEPYLGVLSALCGAFIEGARWLGEVFTILNRWSSDVVRTFPLAWNILPQTSRLPPVPPSGLCSDVISKRGKTSNPTTHQPLILLHFFHHSHCHQLIACISFAVYLLSGLLT